MKKRHIKLVKLEKELIRRLEEVDEERKHIDEEKKAHYESIRNTARQKRKPLALNIAKSKVAKTQRKDNKGEEDIESKKESRRQAFLGNSDLLKQFAQISSAREKIASRIESKIISNNSVSDDVPRSLVRYSSHYNNNEMQNNSFG